MTDLLEHKGYFGALLHNEEDNVFHGKIEFIRDLVTYEGHDREEMKVVFREAVDEYITSSAASFPAR
ncbi:MAG: antitoxin HicB [Alphaproteobacteria bacterium HGW-Alphaproteobacteria-12]|nr:MAG: antitoxin HicB [Alphaproteobacteria bacterium HGW-Alphaproteobacteria-12]